MKSQNPGTNAENIPRSILQSNVPEESRRNGPSLAQIRERAFEIHDWLLAERELQEKYNKSNDGGQRRNDVHTDTIVLAIAKTPAIDRP
jgi:hypothetical protein